MTYTQIAAPPGVSLSPLLTVRGRKGAHQWLTEVLGVPVTLNHVRRAATCGDIPSRKVAGALLFSTQSLFDWATTVGEPKPETGPPVPEQTAGLSPDWGAL